MTKVDIMHQLINIRHFFLRTNASTAIPILKKGKFFILNKRLNYSYTCSYPIMPAKGQLKKAEIAVDRTANTKLP